MAGYSGTPLPKKLGIRQDARVALVNAPRGFADELEPLPAGIELKTNTIGKSAFDIIVFFAKSQAELFGGVSALANRLTPAGGLWIGWPKKASGLATDLSEAIVRAAGLETGLVDNKVCAINDIWSGLRFVIRLKDRLPK